MKRKFGTPYIVFERYSDPDRIYQSYKELFEILEKPLPEKLAGWYQEAKKRSRQQSLYLMAKLILVEIQRFVTMNFTVF